MLARTSELDAGAWHQTARAMHPSPTFPHTVHQQKPIRFVANNEGPYAKRRRINAACLTCRRRKTRCSGERPVCGTCKQNKHECGGYGNENDSSIADEADNQSEEPLKPVKRAFQSDGKESRRNRSPPKTLRPTSVPEPPPLRKTTSGESVMSSSPVLSNHERRTPTESKLLSLSTRNRMPYFRYFGPTAIMPGFKQMVVKVRGKQQSTGASNSETEAPSVNGISIGGGPTPSNPGLEEPSPLEIPVYDSSDMPPPPLITHLCKTFFIHLGCNFPFLQQERFMRDLEEKQVDSILVDAVCAMAARFSNDPMLTSSSESGDTSKKRVPTSDHGAPFSQRAKSAIADTFACPNVAVVQAALLLAYDEFGASRDSGLWMYLGIAIRMAQDLGMQTLEGLRYEGRRGPNPQSVKRPGAEGDDMPSRRSTTPAAVEGEDPSEQRAVERERLDTFWAVFFLDRVISSGTGRPVTLRDRDIEIAFPSLDEVDSTSGWPTPFPALVRVIHLYGRVTDLLNGIRDVSHVTNDLLKRLRSMEVQLTEIYQGLSSNLHFSATNFQHFVKAGQGTNFILLHLWFHTLIVLLHQPTLLKTFEGEIEQLLPNSRELSMSSAKTIADILAFAELIDSKAGMGNPFTSQPIYIAACAFLKETALLTASSNPQSRLGTPPAVDPSLSTVEATSGVLDPIPEESKNHRTSPDVKGGVETPDEKKAAKHTLLAAAANQNYHRCYRGLKSLETYWAGVKYILTILDQKAKGVKDPLLYDREEMESALELPRPEPAFTSPGWRRKLSWGTYLSAQGLGDVAALRARPVTSMTKDGVPSIDPSQAIGWSLTGTMNSPNTSLAVLYSSDTQPTLTRRLPDNERNSSIPSDTRFRNLSPTATLGHITSPHHERNLPRGFNRPNTPSEMAPPPSSSTFQPHMLNEGPPMTDADLLLNLHSPYSAGSPHIGGRTSGSYLQPHHTQNAPGPTSGDYPSPQLGAPQYPLHPNIQNMNYGDMMIESQDIDLSSFGDDVMPWFEYLPQELMNMYDPNGVAAQFPTSGPDSDTSRHAQ